MRSRFPSPGVLFSVALPLFCLSCRPQKPVAAGEVPPVILSDPGGGEHRLFVPDSGTKATVAIFLMTDCPVARAMLPDLNEMAKRYSPLGIHFYGVFADEDPESILRHIGDYRIAFPCLMDDACQLAKISGARRVPEAAIFGPDGMPAVAYRRFTQNDLKFARYNGNSWSLTTVDSAGSVGGHTSLAFGPDGQPAISYRDVSNGDLKFARMGIFAPAP